jgi:hypothetical protein
VKGLAAWQGGCLAYTRPWVQAPVQGGGGTREKEKEILDDSAPTILKCCRTPRLIREEASGREGQVGAKTGGQMVKKAINNQISSERKSGGHNDSPSLMYCHNLVLCRTQRTSSV